VHTYKSSLGSLFHHNSDMSGQVVISTGLSEETRVPFADLVEFVRSRRPTGPRDGQPPKPVNVPRFEERRKALPAAKERVAKLVGDLRDELDKQSPGGLTPFERQMFDVAVNSVKGAR
jgi:hypothetical protein